jgi:hypothetical protein
LDGIDLWRARNDDLAAEAIDRHAGLHEHRRPSRFPHLEPGDDSRRMEQPVVEPALLEVVGLLVLEVSGREQLALEEVDPARAPELVSISADHGSSFLRRTR